LSGESVFTGTEPERRSKLQVVRSRTLAGRGEMADLVRSRDWGATPLGSIESWPGALIAIVEMMLASSVPSALFWGPELVMLYNDAYCPITGVKHPECLGQRGREAWSESWHIVGPEIAEVRRTERAISRENVLIPIARHGEMADFYWSYDLSPVYDNGRVAGVYHTAQDRTEEMRRAQKLRQSEATLEQTFIEMKAIYETTSVALAMIDPVNFRYVRGNPKLGEILGQTVEELVGTPVFDLANDVAGLREALETAASGVPVTGKIIEGELSNLPGVRRAWQVEYIPAFAPDGTVEMIVASSIEITAQRQFQAALVQNEKLAAVGRLAASIAHEINNPLESVMNLLYLCQNSGNQEEVREFLQLAERELLRVSAISNKTLKFNRQSARPLALRSGELTSEVLSIYQARLMNTSVRVDTRDRATATVVCFDGEMRQVLSNLVGNAIDAMLTGGGHLLVRSRDAMDWKTGAKGLLLTVADTGVGMSPETLSKMFDAFFTTKGTNGTGLGLWISQEIVARHGGWLRVRSSQREGGSGTVFRLFLPLDGVAMEQANVA
jgi:PAS domain S-box-containing protein